MSKQNLRNRPLFFRTISRISNQERRSREIFHLQIFNLSLKLCIEMKSWKQVFGVDVSQKELEVSFGKLNEDLIIEIYPHRISSNKEIGFVALNKWILKNTVKDVSLRVVMEVTGLYHQKFAHFIVDKDFDTSIVLPNKISNYLRTLDIKIITNKTCSEAIARFELERKLEKT